MGPVTASTIVDAPRERIFELISDLSARPAFTDHFVRDLHLERIEPSGVGAAARFRLDAPRSAMWMETVIAEADPPARLVERGKGGRVDRVPVHTAWDLLAAPGNSTEVRVAFWTEPALAVDRVRERLGAARWYGRQWRRALRRLKELAETGDTVERVAIGGRERIPT